MQGDADRDLADYPARAFDYAILSQTLAADALDPRRVLTELLQHRRAGDRLVSEFRPLAGALEVLVTSGRMPVTRDLPDPWWCTANIHLCTLRDFTDLCRDLGVRIEASAALTRSKPARQIEPLSPLENLRAEQALFLLSRPAERVAAGRSTPATDDLFG